MLSLLFPSSYTLDLIYYSVDLNHIYLKKRIAGTSKKGTSVRTVTGMRNFIENDHFNSKALPVFPATSLVALLINEFVHENVNFDEMQQR